MIYKMNSWVESVTSTGDKVYISELYLGNELIGFFDIMTLKGRQNKYFAIYKNSKSVSTVFENFFVVNFDTFSKDKVALKLRKHFQFLDRSVPYYDTLETPVINIKSQEFIERAKEVNMCETLEDAKNLADVILNKIMLEGVLE